MCVLLAANPFPDPEAQFQRVVAPLVDEGRRWRGWKRVWCTLLASGGAQVVP